MNQINHSIIRKKKELKDLQIKFKNKSCAPSKQKNFLQMKVNETELWLALGGGLLIALAASLHLALKGRITGMSGLISGVLGNEGSKWKISLLVGMAITSCVFWLIFKFDPIGEEETTVFFSTP